jgi:TolB protein
VNTNPTMSPDGHRIAFVSGRLGRPELYIMDSDGTNVNVLTDYDFSEKNYRSDPDWSPDGRLVAYQERLNDRFQIRTIPVRGGTPKQLTSEGENEQPSWAADARHLVLTSTRSGVRQLWILDTESSRFRQLTKSAGSRLSSWSPRIAQP